MALPSITLQRIATNEEWDTVWNKCSYSTYFHGREWAELWRDYAGLKPHAQLIQFNDGYSAILCTSQKFSKKGIEWISSPVGTYGGWLSLDPLSNEHGRALELLLKSHKGIRWQANPYDPYTPSLGGPEYQESSTHVMNLSRGGVAAFQNWRKTERESVRHAEKIEVNIRQATSMKDWEHHFEAYQDCLKRWGEKASSNYKWELFEAMYRLQSSQIKLWVAEHTGRFISGVICFYAKNHCVAWHSSTVENGRHLASTVLLYHQILLDASQQGLHWFDLNPSGRHSGVRKFKERLGTCELRTPFFKSSLVHSRKKLIWSKIKWWTGINLPV
jgi:hypothetical protein